MTAFCPHCNEALSTYTTIDDSGPKNIEVLVCARCDKVLGLVGPAPDAPPRMDVDAIADVLEAAIDAEDEGQARTLRSVAIGA